MDDTDEVQDKVGAFIRAFYAARYLKSDNTPCQIDQGLYLGSYGVAHNKAALKDLNITHVLVVAKSLDPPYPNDFIYKKIEVLDSPGTKLDRYFEECFSFIDEAKSAEGGVLVHCFAGQSRSATIVIAYLMKKHRMSFSQALEHVKTKRPQIAPNVGFILQLQKFEKSLGVGFVLSSVRSIRHKGIKLEGGWSLATKSVLRSRCWTLAFRPLDRWPY